VSAGEAGAYVSPGDSQAFARVIYDLLEDPQRRAALDRYARMQAETVLDWRLQAAKYVRVFEDLFGSRLNRPTRGRPCRHVERPSVEERSSRREPWS
jgi:hypothetical protein